MADNQPTPQAPEFKQSPNFRKLYCNSVNLDMSPWEFRFTFGEMLKPQPGQARPMIENLIEITVSPQLAKVFLNLLSAHVSEYEKTIGQINLPAPALQPPEFKRQ